MPAESLAALCGLLNRIEADTQALIAQMDAVNEQAARFSVPVGWDNPQNWSTKIELEKQKEEK